MSFASVWWKFGVFFTACYMGVWNSWTVLAIPSAARAAPSSSGPDGCWRSSIAPAAPSAPPAAASLPGRRPRGEAAVLPPLPRCSCPAASVAPAPSARGQQRASVQHPDYRSYFFQECSQRAAVKVLTRIYTWLRREYSSGRRSQFTGQKKQH